MTYERVLVPLDGSDLAECVLSHVEALAKSGVLGQVELVRVVSPTEFHYAAAIPVSEEEEKELTDRSVKEAEAYLQKIGEMFQPMSVKVTTRVLIGNAAQELSDYAEKIGASLIIMATHGRSGASRWVLGSIADKVIRSTQTPVFLVRAQSRKNPA
jgi:nucleotide-binding universal stress UspA family protein